MNQFKLSPDDLKDIQNAAAEAESQTSGEIASAMILESSSYSFPEILFSLFGGVLFFLVSLFAYNPIETFIARLFWEPESWYVTASIGIITIVVIGLLFLITNIPGVDRMIVPAAVRKKKVHRRALVQFLESGVHNTRDRTGILLFISLREQRVEILADVGISALVTQDRWDEILSELTGQIQKGELKQGLITAITDCGKILSTHFSRKSDDTNELPDGLVILEES